MTNYANKTAASGTWCGVDTMAQQLCLCWLGYVLVRSKVGSNVMQTMTVHIGGDVESCLPDILLTGGVQSTLSRKMCGSAI